MQTYLKNILLIIIGWLFVFFGILGLFLPVLQGVLFLLIGLYLLSLKSPLAKRVLGKVRRRFPSLSGKIEHARWLVEKKLSPKK